MADWVKIQIEYENGKTPKELSEIYGLTAQQISRKAYKDGWLNPNKDRNKKVEKSRELYNKKINNLIGKSLDVLEEILNSEYSKESDKINAVKCILDISGLKREVQEIETDDNLVINVICEK